MYTVTAGKLDPTDPTKTRVIPATTIVNYDTRFSSTSCCVSDGQIIFQIGDVGKVSAQLTFDIPHTAASNRMSIRIAAGLNTSTNGTDVVEINP